MESLEIHFHAPPIPLMPIFPEEGGRKEEAVSLYNITSERGRPRWWDENYCRVGFLMILKCNIHNIFVADLTLDLLQRMWTRTN